MLKVEDVHQVEILDLRAGGKGKYLEFLREMATHVHQLLDSDRLAGRRLTSVSGTPEEIVFNKIEVEGYYKGIKVENTYLRDLFDTMILMRRHEYRQLVEAVMERDLEDPAVKLFEEMLFGKEKTTFLRNVRSVYSQWFSAEKKKKNDEKPKRDHFLDSPGIDVE
jgi:hypothetical protein